MGLEEEEKEEEGREGMEEMREGGQSRRCEVSSDWSLSFPQ